MAKNQAGADDPRPEAETPKPEDLIRLDFTRTKSGVGPGTMGPVRVPDYSEIRGHRLPDDPHYRVAYMQDGLPFDSEGNLVPDDGKTGPWSGLGEDGKPITYRPLYDKVMRDKLAKKVKRAIAGLRAAAPEDSDLAEDIDARDAESDEVNLAMWLQGKLEYQPFMVYAAIRKRYSVAVMSVQEAVNYLMVEKQVVHHGTLRPEFKNHLRKAA